MLHNYWQIYADILTVMFYSHSPGGSTVLPTIPWLSSVVQGKWISGSWVMGHGSNGSTNV